MSVGAMIVHLARLGATKPRQGAEAVLALNAPAAALWPLAGLSAVSFTLVIYALFQIWPPLEFQLPDGSVQTLEITPIPFAIGIYLTNIVYAWLASLLGRQIEGKARFEETYALVIYLQFLLAGLFTMCLILSGMGLWTIGALLLLVGGLYSLVLNVIFLDVAHRFASLTKSVFLFIATYVGISLGQMLLTTLTGARLAG